MSQRVATILSRFLVALAAVMAIAVVPLAVRVSHIEPRQIVVVGDGSAPSMQEARDEIETRLAEGDDLAPEFDLGETFIYVLLLGWVATGALIVSRRASNLAGWVFCAVGTSFIVAQFAQLLAVYGVKLNPGSIPAVGFWAILGEYSFGVIGLLPLLFLLYPDGRPPTRRWRWASRALFAGLAIAFVPLSLQPGPLNNYVDLGILYANPIGIEGVADPLGAVIAVGALLAIGASLSSVVALIQRFRGSSGEERQKLRWLAYVAGLAGGLLVIMLLLILASPLLADSEGDAPIFNLLFGAIALTLIIGVPAAYLIAIFRYGLWQLDVVIRKTILYGLLVGLFLAVGAVLILVVGQTLVGRPSGSQWVLVVAGLAMGLLFVPLRRIAGKLADRIVFRKRATPYQVLTTFSGRVGETYAAEDVLPRMAEVLAGGLGAEVARVWLRLGRELVPEASWPDGPAPPPLHMGGDNLPALDAEQGFEVRHQGELLGALSVRMPASDPMTGSKERLAKDLASQAGPVLRNVRLIEDLRASRQRLVAAQDEERRKIERNIHDGAQQQLVALQVKLGLVRTLAGRDPDKEHELLDQLQSETQAALEDLRDLARGIYPPLLADRGLVAALEAQARKALLPVEIEADGIGRYSQEAEAAVYFCALEALQNMAKYAGATQAHIRLTQSNGQLTFEVRDDGRGFDPADTKPGSGLINMSDRLEALGGSLSVTSKPGEGTTVTGSIPVVTR